uniref:Outer dense fiber of sperm tails 3-like 2b n=1 Tax=Oreochromis aureus TaxID=47969 RepID=A0AAZ1XND2_OREAU
AKSKMEKKYPVIAGREKGPGPGRYGLPPTIGFIGHDFTKSTSPAYSFHGRMTDNSDQIHRLVKKTCTFDPSGEPHVIVFCSLEELFHTPGPGAYSPERAPPCNLQRRPPSYTMGSRTHYRSVDSVPAPNKYSLPPLMGAQVPNKTSSASYTISGCLSIGGPSEDLAKTPAPCRYNSTDPNVYLLRRPAFSMLGRHSLPRDGTKKPGPGTYNPEKVTVHKAQAPAYSLGIRHSEFVTPLIVNISD